MVGNQSSVFDSELYSTLFTQPDMKKIWSDENLINCWLKFETTISQVQSDLDVIPKQAAIEIKKACETLIIDWNELTKGTQLVGMAIKPLIDQIADNGSDLVKKYLHWGCTTQDLLDTALAMRLQQTLVLVREQLLMLGDELKKMAKLHNHTVMVARTNSVDASATTWGLQVSSYLGEISRHLQRLHVLYPRAIVGTFGGAVGNLASVGKKGLDIRNNLMRSLNLSAPIGFVNASQDSIVEVVQFFSIIHGTLCRIANDVETMGRTAIAELMEGEGGGGSSTMPHKSNPRASNMMQTLSRLGWMYASGAPNLLDQNDVRSASMRVLNWSIVPEAALVLSTSLMRAHCMIKCLIVHKDNMKRNFHASKNFIMSESISMKLAESIGREKAYNLISKLLKEADGTKTLDELLLSNEAITSILSKESILEACNPLFYLGSNDDLINEAIHFYDHVKNISS